MTTIYVAASKGLAEWGAAVGLTKFVFKVGLAEGDAKAAVEALNAARHAGHEDWKLLKHADAGATDEATALARLTQRERPVDPAHYPQIKGAPGIFKVKPANVERQMTVERALAGDLDKMEKLKPVDIAAYLINNALK